MFYNKVICNKGIKLIKYKIVAIIPARGGSKGIPHKNIRLLAGKPLISYVLKAALASKYIKKVIVSTEDELIAQISNSYGVEIIKRPEELAKDETTLDPVIFHALKFVEIEEGNLYDLIITIQPTSPLLSTGTIDRAIENMCNNNYDTLISVTSERHLYWYINKDIVTPLYEERSNRQLLKPIYKESGALVISRREIVTERNRFGQNIHLYEMPIDESLDIDTYEDWIKAESIINKKNIIFRVDGDIKIGLGHIYRALTLANQIYNHNVIFLMNESMPLGINKVKEYNFKPITFKDDNELEKIIDEIHPNIIINDILDTKKEYIVKLKNKGYFVVNFEDLGEGADLANITINALYEHSYPDSMHFYGYRYLCLAEQFYYYPPIKVKEAVNNILISFGGVDENNLTLKVLKAITKAELKEIKLTIILGPGYQFYGELQNYLKDKVFNIEIKSDIKDMAAHIYNSDIAITSNGRTVYEVACLGVPCIAISQNEREVTHLFSRICSGIINLGMGNTVSIDSIEHEIIKLISNYSLREQMSKKSLEYNLKSGLNRVIKLILDKYDELLLTEPK